MTIKVLKKALEEAVNNGLGDCQIYVRSQEDKDEKEKRKEIEFIKMCYFDDEKYGEVIFRR